MDLITNALLCSNRKSYKIGWLDENSADKNPFQQFDKWLKEALISDPDYANSMVLSTVNSENMPDSRIVLLKNVSHGGFTFYTNYNSKKGKDLKNNPHASLLFFWKEEERQVRIQGTIEVVPDYMSEHYFDSRPFESKVGACISDQSSPVKSREYMEELFIEQLNKYADKKINRPASWGGYLLVPSKFEFWQGRDNRLHDRIQYEKESGKEEWSIKRLMP
jgi:pyridoxamine 5'-phosphate oxidase